jgi:hypothetical protein
MNVLSNTPKKMDATVIIVRRLFRQMFRHASFMFVLIVSSFKIQVSSSAYLRLVIGHWLLDIYTFILFRTSFSPSLLGRFTSLLRAERGFFYLIFFMF